MSRLAMCCDHVAHATDSSSHSLSAVANISEFAKTAGSPYVF